MRYLTFAELESYLPNCQIFPEAGGRAGLVLPFPITMTEPIFVLLEPVMTEAEARGISLPVMNADGKVLSMSGIRKMLMLSKREELVREMERLAKRREQVTAEIAAVDERLRVMDQEALLTSSSPN